MSSLQKYAFTTATMSNITASKPENGISSSKYNSAEILHRICVKLTYLFLSVFFRHKNGSSPQANKSARFGQQRRGDAAKRIHQAKVCIKRIPWPVQPSKPAEKLLTSQGEKAAKGFHQVRFRHGRLQEGQPIGIRQ